MSHQLEFPGMGHLQSAPKHQTLSDQQFGPHIPDHEPIPMFLETSDLIDNYNKADTSALPSVGPKGQWEDPGSGDGEDDYGQRMSLREEKLAQVEDRSEYSMYARDFPEAVLKGKTPPITIEHDWDMFKPKMVLDGHHRLAVFEKYKAPLVPVEHDEW